MSRVPPGRSKLTLAALVLAAIVAVGLWSQWGALFGASGPVKEPPPDAGPPSTQKGEPPPRPSTREGDQLLQSLAPSWRASPDLLKWLSSDDIIRRLVTAVILVAQGRSPRVALPFLQIDGYFKPKSPDRLTIDPESFDRYTPLVRTFTSIDAKAAGAAYSRFRPYFEAAFDEGAAPGERFEDTLNKAIDNILRAKIPHGPITLVPKGAIYLFADPRLESSSAVEKHMIRIGPDHAKAIQDFVRQFATSAGVRAAP
ncbi:MAG: DUF3014 domain-containing protein [Deltaproteobacteria bacterium]|nr:DUF3014 domain-containing protein [Deltaproteobacteria bacterium]